MCKISVNEIEIIPIRPQGGLVGFASFVLNNSLYVGGVGIHSSPSCPGESRLLFPTKTLRNGQHIRLVYPIEHSIGETIRQAVIAQYSELMGFD